jgi:hypothetical protein
MTAETIHLFDDTYGLLPTDGDPAAVFVAPGGTKLFVVKDDGTTSTVSVTWTPTLAQSYQSGVYQVQANHLYTITDASLALVRYTNQGFVSGVLAVPFKMHISDRSVTAGSTIGAYIGYQTSLFNSITVTPVFAGGLALVPVSNLNSPNATTATGVSVATGLIGTWGPHGTGIQVGVLVGVDYVGKQQNYQYEGKPWLSFEVGYSFGN